MFPPPPPPPPPGTCRPLPDGLGQGTPPPQKKKIIFSQFQFRLKTKISISILSTQIVIPGWTAGGVRALWVSEHPLWRTRYLKLTRVYFLLTGLYLQELGFGV